MRRMTHNVPYRVRETTFAILTLDGSRISITLPVNAIVLLIDGPLDGHRLVEILWEGKTLLMFTQDLRSRCDALDQNGEVIPSGVG
jgi:hypothetical protein